MLQRSPSTGARTLGHLPSSFSRSLGGGSPRSVNAAHESQAALAAGGNLQAGSVGLQAGSGS